MIIYGSKAVHLITVPSNTATCPSCGTKGSLTFSIFRKHAHIFWIPLFPFGKAGMSQCQHCKQVLEKKEMPEPIRREYDTVKSEAKGPVWQFSGLGLLAVLMTSGYFASAEDKKLELVYLNAPQPGDIYEYKIETGSYSTLKVVDITDDSVFVSPNDYEINRRSKLRKIDKAHNYPDVAYGISRIELKDMYDSGEIFNINR
jgi:hypothetical protein